MATDKFVTGWVRIGGNNVLPEADVDLVIVTSNGRRFRYVIGVYSSVVGFHHGFELAGSMLHDTPVAWKHISGPFHGPPEHWVEPKKEK